MDRETVIDWHLTKLQNGEDAVMSDAMRQLVDADPQLAQELETLRLFWQSESALPSPPPAIQQSFYRQLNDTLRDSRPPTRSFHWLQAAAIIGVFVLGFAAGKLPGSDNQRALVALQQEVANLNTVMAINMLQHQSASQRLVGANYTRQADIKNPGLAKALLSVFANEQTTSVKLALVDALSETGDLAHIETELLALTLNEPLPIVQMALCRLLLNNGSITIQNALFKELNTRDIDPDVKDFLQQLAAQNMV